MNIKINAISSQELINKTPNTLAVLNKCNELIREATKLDLLNKTHSESHSLIYAIDAAINEIIGLIYVLRQEKELNLLYAYVKKEYRESGIAQKMCKHIEETAPAEISTISITPMADSTETKLANAGYKKRGYTFHKTITSEKETN